MGKSEDIHNEDKVSNVLSLSKSNPGKISKKKKGTISNLSSASSVPTSNDRSTSKSNRKNMTLKNAVLSSYPELESNLTPAERTKNTASKTFNKRMKSLKSSRIREKNKMNSARSNSADQSKFTDSSNSSGNFKSGQGLFDWNWKQPLNFFGNILLSGLPISNKNWLYKSENQDSSFSVPWKDSHLLDHHISKVIASPLAPENEEHLSEIEPNSSVQVSEEHICKDKIINLSQIQENSETSVTKITQTEIDNSHSTQNDLLQNEIKLEENPIKNDQITQPVVENLILPLQEDSPLKKIDRHLSPTHIKTTSSNQITGEESQNNNSYILEKDIVQKPELSPIIEEKMESNDNEIDIIFTEYDFPTDQNSDEKASNSASVKTPTENSNPNLLNHPDFQDDSENSKPILIVNHQVQNEIISDSLDSKKENNYSDNTEALILEPQSKNILHNDDFCDLENKEDSSPENHYNLDDHINPENHDPQESFLANLQLITNHNYNLENLDYLAQSNDPQAENSLHSTHTSEKHNFNYKNIPLSTFNYDDSHQSDTTLDLITNKNSPVWPTRNMYDMSNSGVLSSIFKRPSDKKNPLFSNKNVDFTSTSTLSGSSKKIKIENFDSFSSCLSAIGSRSSKLSKRNGSVLIGSERLATRRLKGKKPKFQTPRPYFGIGYGGESSPFQKLNIKSPFLFESAPQAEDETYTKTPSSTAQPQSPKNSSGEVSIGNQSPNSSTKKKPKESVTAKVLLSIIKEKDNQSEINGFDSPSKKKRSYNIDTDTDKDSNNEQKDLPDSENGYNSDNINSFPQTLSAHSKGPLFQLSRKRQNSPRISLQSDLLSQSNNDSNSEKSSFNSSMSTLLETAPEEVKIKNKSILSQSVKSRATMEISNFETRDSILGDHSDVISTKEKTDEGSLASKSLFNGNKKILLARSRRKNGYSMFSSDITTQTFGLPFQSKMQIKKKKSNNSHSFESLPYKDVDMSKDPSTSLAMDLDRPQDLNSNKITEFESKSASSIFNNQISHTHSSLDTSIIQDQNLPSESLQKTKQLGAIADNSIVSRLGQPSLGLSDPAKKNLGNISKEISSHPGLKLKPDEVINNSEGNNQTSCKTNLFSLNKKDSSATYAQPKPRDTFNHKITNPHKLPSSEFKFIINSSHFPPTSILHKVKNSNKFEFESSGFSKPIKEMYPFVKNIKVRDLPPFNFVKPKNSKIFSQNNQIFTFQKPQTSSSGKFGQMSKSLLANNKSEFSQIRSLVLNLKDSELPQYNFKK
ncbi:hypothetical protein AYI68_g4547 [Smittium mucronatum]|uniref:Uncharacterized protein n=1 Tax=Smittium mucronatum TaxID=133383 RepID=A0A1R0GWX2_9FUNG|nr:hypothetical protein AYI68_g4547 [Smittium mucronatum]